MKVSVLEQFKQGSSVRNVLTLMSGTAIAQGLTLGFAPVLTRIYKPEDFGVLGLYISIVGILSVIICWRYELAIVLPRENKDAINILIMSVIINAGMCILALLGVVFFADTLSSWVGMPELVSWLWLMPISLFLVGLYQAFNYWLTRNKQFKGLSISKVNRAATGGGCQLGLGFLTNLGAGGLLGGYIFGQLAGAGVLIGQVLKNDCKAILGAISRSTMIKQAGKYRKYPIYGSWPSLLNNLTASIPVFFFARFFDSAIVGFYSLGMRILQVPISVIGMSISQVFFQRIAEEYSRGGIVQPLVQKTFKRLFLLSLPVLCVMLLAPPLFELLFGVEWRIAGVYVQILSPALAIKFVASPLSIVFEVLNRQEISTIWKIISLISTSAFLIGSLSFNSPFYSVVFLSINDTFLYSLYLLMIFKVSDVCIKDLLRGLL